MEYFNYLSQCTESIDTALDFYFVRSGENDPGPYRFVISPQVAELLARDAITNLGQFYRVSRRWVTYHPEELFVEGEPNAAPWTLKKIQQILGSSYQEKNWQPFGSLIQQQIPIKQYIQIISESSSSETQKLWYLQWLTSLCIRESYQRVFSALDGVDMLVEVMRSRKQDELFLIALRFLENISVHDFIQDALYKKGSIDYLMHLLIGSEDNFVQNSVIEIFISILASKKTHELFCKSRNFPALISLMLHTSEENLSSLMIVFRILCSKTENHEALFASGMVRLLIKAISNDFNENIKEDALHCLLNLCDPSKGREQFFYEHGCLALFSLIVSSRKSVLKRKAFQLLKKMFGSIENMIVPVALALFFYVWPKSLMQTPEGAYIAGGVSLLIILFLRALFLKFSDPQNAEGKIFFRTKMQNMLMFQTQTSIKSFSEVESDVNLLPV